MRPVEPFDEVWDLGVYPGTLEEPQPPISRIVRPGDWIEWEDRSAKGTCFETILDSRGEVNAVVTGQLRYRGKIVQASRGYLVCVRPLNSSFDRNVRYSVEAKDVKRILTAFEDLAPADQVRLIDQDGPDLIRPTGPSPDWPSR